MQLSTKDRNQLHVALLSTTRALAARSLQAASAELLKQGATTASKRQLYEAACQQVERFMRDNCREILAIAKGALLLAAKDGQVPTSPDDPAYQAYADTYAFMIHAALHDAIERAFEASHNLEALFESFEPENPTIN